MAARQRSLTSGPPVPSAQEQLLVLRLQEQKLLNTHNEDSRQVQNVRREIALVEGFLKDEATGHTGRHGEELAILSTRKKSLEERLAQIEGDLGSLPALSGRYRELKRVLDAREATYKRVTSRLENARTSAEMDRQKIANISVIQPAYAPLDPVSPRPMLNLVVAVIVGGGLAVGAALAMEGCSRRLVAEAAGDRSRSGAIGVCASAGTGLRRPELLARGLVHARALRAVVDGRVRVAQQASASSRSAAVKSRTSVQNSTRMPFGSCV